MVFFSDASLLQMPKLLACIALNLILKAFGTPLTYNFMRLTTATAINMQNDMNLMSKLPLRVHSLCQNKLRCLILTIWLQPLLSFRQKDSNLCNDVEPLVS